MNCSQLAVTTMCYCAFPLERALAGIASCGITVVELCASVGYCDHAAPERLAGGGAGELRRILERHGMRAASLSAHADITTEAGLRAVTARLNLAADSGISILITSSLPLDRTDPGLAERFRRLIVELAEQAARRQMTLCLETTGMGMRTVRDSVGLLEQLQHPALRINYDPAAHAYCFGEPPPLAADLAAWSDRLGHVHLNNKASLARARWDFRPVDEGIVQWHPILKALNRMNFGGPAAIEIGWETVPRAPEVVDAAVCRCVRFLDNYFDRVEKPGETLTR